VTVSTSSYEVTMRHRKPGALEAQRELLREQGRTHWARGLDEKRHAEMLANVATWSQDMREEFEERAAIIEFCGNETRQVAEQKAFARLTGQADE
jgi:hypothetical protein